MQRTKTRTGCSTHQEDLNGLRYQRASCTGVPGLFVLGNCCLGLETQSLDLYMFESVVASVGPLGLGALEFELRGCMRVGLGVLRNVRIHCFGVPY